MLDTIRDFLDTLAGDFFYWLTQHVGLLLVILSILVILEGLVLVILPKRIKTMIERLPIIVLRLLGILGIIGGGLVLYLYLRILQYL